MEDVTDAAFDEQVLRSELPVVVDFWAPWCGPCNAVEPIFQELAREHAGRVRFVRVNVDENFVSASQYNVLSIPTAILFEGGEAKETVVGARPRAHYERVWINWLGTA